MSLNLLITYSVFMMTSMIDKYDSIIKLYGIQNYTKIKESKILIVGAGGIGCEVNELTHIII